MFICLIFKEFGALQYRKFAYLVEELKDRCGILGVLKITNHNDVQVYNSDKYCLSHLNARFTPYDVPSLEGLSPVDIL